MYQNETVLRVIGLLMADLPVNKAGFQFGPSSDSIRLMQ